MRPRSDGEVLARTRLLIAALGIYLLTMAFMALAGRLYQGTEHLALARLAALPFFVLLLLRFMRLVRVAPPEVVREARQLMALGRTQAARDKWAAIREGRIDGRRLDRARRLLQDGLAVPLAEEALLQQGRCSLLLGELARAIDELDRAHAALPARADAAIDLAEALHRAGQAERAAEVLRAALPVMDAVDRQTLAEQPALRRLLGETPLPRRSRFARRILLERVLLAILVGVALLHGLRLYVGVPLPLLG